MPANNVLDRMTAQYNNMTRSNRKITDYIFSHQLQAQYMSITTLAEECHVAVATITRFCRDLGFSGYNAFKLALAKAIQGGNAPRIEDEYTEDSISPDDTLEATIGKLCARHSAALALTAKKLDEERINNALRILLNAERVFCFGQGGSMVAAMACWSRFASVTTKFSCIQDSHLQTITCAVCEPKDVILYFSYSGSTHEVVENLALAKERGAQIILITHFLNSPASQYADVAIHCGPNEDPRNSGSMYIKVSQLFMIDVLYHRYCAMTEDSESKLENTAEAISRRHY